MLEPPVVQAQPPRPVPPPQAAEPLDDADCLLWFCFESLPKWAQWVIKYVVPPVLGIGLILLTIVILKARRARRRRTRGTPVSRISGAWQELVDRLRDHGQLATQPRGRPPPSGPEPGAASVMRQSRARSPVG